MIDAPVRGGPHGADAATIAIMVSASAELFAKVKPIFEMISDSATPMVFANVVRQLFQTAINQHAADKDTQTLVKPFERNAKLAVASPKMQRSSRVAENNLFTRNVTIARHSPGLP